MSESDPPAGASAASSFDSALIYGDRDQSVPPLFVAVGDAVYTSVDGVQWNRQPISIRDGATAVYGNGRVLVVGTGGTLIVSENGSNWKEIGPEIEHLFGTNAVTYGNERFVAVGEVFKGIRVDAMVATSPDGINWTPIEVPHLPRGLESVAYGKGKFVAVGDGYVATSPDGTVWTLGPFDYPKQLFDVAYGNGTFVISGGRGSVFTSRDGVTWRTERSGLSNQFIVGSVTYGNGTFVAVGYEHIDDGEFVSGEGYGVQRPVNKSAILTSQDSVNWQVQHSSASQTLVDVAFGKDRFVALGDNEGPKDQWGNATSHNAVVITSNDGADWTATEAGGRSVMSEEGYFLDSSPDDPSLLLVSVIYWPAPDE